MLLDIIAELLLFLTLDSVEAVDNGIIVNILFKTLESVKVSLPAAANLFCDKCAELGLAQTQPAAGCDAVCLVLEALGIKLIPVLENIVFQDLGMKLRNAVCMGRTVDSHSCHMDKVAVDDLH